MSNRREEEGEEDEDEDDELLRQWKRVDLGQLLQQQQQRERRDKEILTSKYIKKTKTNPCLHGTYVDLYFLSFYFTFNFIFFLVQVRRIET